MQFIFFSIHIYTFRSKGFSTYSTTIQVDTHNIKGKFSTFFFEVLLQVYQTIKILVLQTIKKEEKRENKKQKNCLKKKGRTTESLFKATSIRT